MSTRHYQAQFSLQETGSEPVPRGIGPKIDSPSKIGIHFLASQGSIGKDRNSLACLRDAGSYVTTTQCKLNYSLWDLRYYGRLKTLLQQLSIDRASVRDSYNCDRGEHNRVGIKDR